MNLINKCLFGRKLVLAKLINVYQFKRRKFNFDLNQCIVFFFSHTLGEKLAVKYDSASYRENIQKIVIGNCIPSTLPPNKITGSYIKCCVSSYNYKTKWIKLQSHLLLNLRLAAYIHGNTMLSEYYVCDR